MAGKARQLQLPLLALRGLCVLPGTLVTFQVGRPASVSAVDAAVSGRRRIVLATQKDQSVEIPSIQDVHATGTLAEVKQVVRESSSVMRVTVLGLARVRVVSEVQSAPHLRVRVQQLADVDGDAPEVNTLRRALLRRYRQYLKLVRKAPPEPLPTLAAMDDTGRLTDIIAGQVAGSLAERQSLLETPSVRARLERVLQIVEREIEFLKLEAKIQSRVQQELEKSQREFYLREQLKAIQRELGDRDALSESERFREDIAAAGLPGEVRERALREVDRLEKMPPLAAEAVVVRNYLDWLLNLPWTRETQDRLDLAYAERILNEEHFGLWEVKERILEYLAVRQLAPRVRTPILCLVGPPGSGKTSLARSIARALDRRFVRVSLGGVRDEAEIRGHRRTYVGALPGRIIQGIRQAGTRNPVFLLDEIDKVGADFRGDPAAALLEALDPEQNRNFSDHYLEAPFDLSQVLFVTTANVTHTIPRALLDRLEVIRISGYTDEEKLEIARRHLLPRQRSDHGLDERQLTVSVNALAEIIRSYTREAGVRALERQLATLCRKAARRIISGESRGLRITRANLHQFLGRPRFRSAAPERNHQVGVVMGMAWTQAGGQVMPVEVAVVPGSGSLILTGQLGDVMRESAQAALTYVRSRARQLGLPDDFYGRYDVHVHVPEGAVPKDGPSAGVSIAVGLASALTGRPVRGDLAMSGEITLHGRILPVGGIKEKVLAAHRAGIYRVLLPMENEADLDDVPAEIRRRMRFVLVGHVDQVLEDVLLRAGEPAGRHPAGQEVAGEAAGPAGRAPLTARP